MSFLSVVRAFSPWLFISLVQWHWPRPKSCSFGWTPILRLLSSTALLPLSILLWTESIFSYNCRAWFLDESSSPLKLLQQSEHWIQHLFHVLIQLKIAERFQKWLCNDIGFSLIIDLGSKGTKLSQKAHHLRTRSLTDVPSAICVVMSTFIATWALRFWSQISLWGSPWSVACGERLSPCLQHVGHGAQ